MAGNPVLKVLEGPNPSITAGPNRLGWVSKFEARIQRRQYMTGYWSTESGREREIMERCGLLVAV